MQESKESLERLRRMGAFEAQDFDTTVSLVAPCDLSLLCPPAQSDCKHKQSSLTVSVGGHSVNDSFVTSSATVVAVAVWYVPSWIHAGQ